MESIVSSCLAAQESTIDLRRHRPLGERLLDLRVHLADAQPRLLDVQVLKGSQELIIGGGRHRGGWGCTEGGGWTGTAASKRARRGASCKGVEQTCEFRRDKGAVTWCDDKVQLWVGRVGAAIRVCACR